MKLIGSTEAPRNRALTQLLQAALAITAISTSVEMAHAEHVLGLDTSLPTNATQWGNAWDQGYRFAYLRSSRGGTVADSFNDTQFYNSISLATNAGLLAGSYHFTRPDSTTVHSGDDEAQHFMSYAGMYMKPGYMLPVVDAEARLNNVQNPSGLSTWLLDMVDSIEAKMHFTPLVYASSSYANDELGKSLAFSGSTPRTYLWLARYATPTAEGNPPPLSPYPNSYGMWDLPFTTRTNSRDPAIKPWIFWQQQGTHTPSGMFAIDTDYANGNMEFVKDFLVPALYDDWDGAGAGVPDGNWTSLANWNSNNLAYTGAIQNGPASRLPNSLDWVKLQYSGGGTVTLASGAQSIRKFYTQQPLNITGGSLSIGYIPGSGGQFDVPSEFKAAVTISGAGGYSAHTTQVDGGGGAFNVNGGTVTFTDIQLASDASNSGKLVMGGNATFAQTGGAGTSLIRSTGSLAQAGSVTLSAGNQTFNVNNGTAGVDLQIRTAVTGAGRLVKGGAGTMLVSSTNTYSGGTTITSGILDVAADSRFGAVPGSPQSDNIILDGGTLRTGAQVNSASLTNSGAGYTSFPTVTVGGAGADAQAASVNLLASIGSIAVTAGGSGYVNQSGAGSPPTNGSAGTFVDIVGGGGTGATARAAVSGGVITAINIVNPGTGYTSMPTVFISGTGSTPGTGATANVSGITLQTVTLNDGGFDYTTPTIGLAGGGGSGATASATSAPSWALNSNRGVTLTANGGTLNQTAGTTLTIGGPISSTGSGTLTKSGAGTLVLGGANTYTGSTAIGAGTLQIAGSERVPNGSAVTVSGGAIFDLQNNNETIGSLAGSGSVTNAGLLDTGGDDTSTTFSGTIGGGSLRKSGLGKLTLAGSNSYSGDTSILGGTLSGNTIANLGTNSNYGTGNFSIANGATLEYAGFSGSTNRSISLGTGGGIVSVINSGALSLSGVIDGSALTKNGLGALIVRGANTYSGGTTVAAGVLNVFGATAKLGTGDVTVQGTTTDTVLTIQTGVNNAIDDSATLSLLGGGGPGGADQGYVDLGAGINETIGSLLLGGVAQAYGITYGSTASSALFTSDEYFSGAGLVSVGLLGDFNNDHSVDAGDYAAWRKSPSTYGGSAGYDLWQANFGNTSPGSGSGNSLDGGTVPEPAAAVLLIFGLAALAIRNRNR